MISIFDSRATAIAGPQLFPVVLVSLLLGLTGCTTAYYGAMERVGTHKRDILKSRIESGREDQKEAQAQFKTTYQRFAELTQYSGDELEDAYNDLNREYKRSQARADDVSSRILSIERVANDLFEEWRSEIELIGNAKLARQSRESLRSTETRYDTLIMAMKRAEAKMPPVLSAFNDQVLYLKHSLNARAIAALESTLGEMENEVASLLRDIDDSIRESERFLETFERNG